MLICAILCDGSENVRNRTDRTKSRALMLMILELNHTTAKQQVGSKDYGTETILESIWALVNIILLYQR